MMIYDDDDIDDSDDGDDIDGGGDTDDGDDIDDGDYIDDGVDSDDDNDKLGAPASWQCVNTSALKVSLLVDPITESIVIYLPCLS